MNQLVQKLSSGEMKVIEAPIPVLNAGCLLIKNHYSVISAGTEGSTVKTARKSLLMKAKERPQQVAQVLDVLKKQGPIQTYRAVMKKLDSYSPLGYSSAGEVILVADGVQGFKTGDLVACGGAGYANHAEIICVPVHLCTLLPPRADLKKAAYNTLGAIALQGIRQADLRLGETCAVIGLGLLGQLTCLMLKASGIRVIGIDVDSNMVQLAKSHCVDRAFHRSEPGIADQIEFYTEGLGVDAVIITAGTDSLDPVNFAGQIARKKGKVIVVGAAPTGFDRDPYYYRKELELRMSCSYGPGRYDLDYEELAIDYPPAYVRWTENRNMQAFQHLVQIAQLPIDYLTTHEFPLEEASNAYDMIVKRSEAYIGIVIRYNIQKKLDTSPIKVGDAKPETKVGIAFIGAGSYAQSHLLPNLPRSPKISLKGIMSHSGSTSKRCAEKYGFEFCTSQETDLFNAPEINTIFIATRHDTHADYVMKSIDAQKNVFVEKPLCLSKGQLEQIREKIKIQASNGTGKQLMVGFNRRFSPAARLVKERLTDSPVAMIYRINSGFIPADHWIQNLEIGGGRVVGEVCHFIDFMTFMANSIPTKVFACAISDAHKLTDTLAITVHFENGSIGNISYFSNGSKSLEKEYFEVYQSGLTGIIRDFKSVEAFGKQRLFRKSFLQQDKGQKDMIAQFLKSMLEGGTPLISWIQIYQVTKATFAVLDSISQGRVIDIDAYEN